MCLLFLPPHAYSAMREEFMWTSESFLLIQNSFGEINTFHQQILRLKDKDLFPGWHEQYVSSNAFR
ncbi:hypothetical protein BGW80DRAFT_1167759 [Lactifluus volemus]|nr:hypothetical protein BGW80DRAFT_1167759 [Lactifluus volemus]